RQLAEHALIVAGKLAQVQEVPAGGDISDAPGLGRGAEQVVPHLVQAQVTYVGNRRDAQHALETVLQRALTDVQRKANVDDARAALLPECRLHVFDGTGDKRTGTAKPDFPGCLRLVARGGLAHGQHDLVSDYRPQV